MCFFPLLCLPVCAYLMWCCFFDDDTLYGSLFMSFCALFTQILTFYLIQTIAMCCKIATNMSLVCMDVNFGLTRRRGKANDIHSFMIRLWLNINRDISITCTFLKNASLLYKFCLIYCQRCAISATTNYTELMKKRTATEE